MRIADVEWEAVVSLLVVNVFPHPGLSSHMIADRSSPEAEVGKRRSTRLAQEHDAAVVEQATCRCTHPTRPREMPSSPRGSWL
jgi:hypothetical protein